MAVGDRRGFPPAALAGNDRRPPRAGLARWRAAGLVSRVAAIPVGRWPSRRQDVRHARELSADRREYGGTARGDSGSEWIRRAPRFSGARASDDARGGRFAAQPARAPRGMAGLVPAADVGSALRFAQQTHQSDAVAPEFLGRHFLRARALSAGRTRIPLRSDIAAASVVIGAFGSARSVATA